MVFCVSLLHSSGECAGLAASSESLSHAGGKYQIMGRRPQSAADKVSPLALVSRDKVSSGVCKF